MSKKDKGILLSPKHGVNPSIMHCFICGKETGLALLGKLKGDAEAPKDMTNPNELCDECRQRIKDGNKFILEVEDNADKKNPYRTGRLVCIKGTALPEIKDPVSYMEYSVFEKLFGEFLKEE